MKLIYGTFNPSKLRSMKKMLEGLNFEITGLTGLDVKIEEANEIGKDPLENAIIKAKAYYDQLQKPVFSCDSGLYFEEVSQAEQPGVYIKRVKGAELTDHEMMQHYSLLAEKYGGKLTAYYKNAICLVLDHETILMSDDVSLNSERFFLVTQPHSIYRKGFPLDSLSVDIQSGKYYYDLEGDSSESLGVIDGVRAFFSEVVVKLKS